MSDQFEDIQSSFVEHAIGGQVKGKPRSFLKWIERHVIKGDALRPGGVSVLKLLLAAAADSSWVQFNKWRAKRTWTTIRTETAVQDEKKKKKKKIKK